MWTRRLFFALFVLTSLGIGFMPAVVLAQSESTTEVDTLAHYGVRCQDGRCTITVDAGVIDVDVPVPTTAPLQLSLPDENLGIFSGAAVEIGDGFTLGLDAGDIHVDSGNMTVGVDEAGRVQRLQGSAAAALPSILLPNNVRIGGAFPAEFGYDSGANMGDLSHLLDPEQQYLYLRLGNGFVVETTLTDEEGGRAPITLAVPENETATLVIDPENQLLYLDGRFNISQVLRLAVVGATLGIDVGQLPMLSGLAIPLESTVGMAMLLSRDPARNFIEMGGDLAVEGGPLGRLLQLEGAPFVLDSAIRIDRSGLKLQGTADANLAPRTFLESGGTVELFVPFERLGDAYVRLGGDLSVPVLGLAAANETVLQRDPDGNVVVTDLPWWDQARNWIGSAASRGADTITEGAERSIDTVQDVVDSVRNRGSDSADDARADGMASAGALDISCSVNRAQQLWCQTTGLCDVPDDTCPPATVGN